MMGILILYSSDICDFLALDLVSLLHIRWEAIGIPDD